MTQYVGCEHARTLLEGLIDGELSMADQLAVESHLRWCDTCGYRVEDMRLIGDSLRARSSGRPIDDRADDAILTSINESLLMRVRAEQAQSLPSRVREMFADMRLLWPALGATVAVLLCVAAATSVLHASAVREPDSLAAMISALGSPGSEMNPLRPADNGVSIPRLRDAEAKFAGGTVEQMPEDDVIYAFRTVVGRDGSTSNYELLLSDDGASAGGRAAAGSTAREQALLNAVRKARFDPAQTPLGHAVAVDVVWVIAKTTIVAGPPESLRSRAAAEPRIKDAPKPATPEPGPPVSGQPQAQRRSATA